MASTGSEASSGSNPMSRASRWVLAAAIAGSALAVGTVHTITLCIVTAVLAVAAVLAWWGAEPMKARSAATLLLFTGIGLTAYTALQCVPMPIGWLAVIAPHNADVWSRALAPLHEPGPSWAPISLDPTATRVEVLKGVAYLLAFVTALRVARRRDGVEFLSAVIVATAIALALSALLHPAFGERKLFGVYEPGAGIPDRHVAPFMNPNHLAAYLNVAFCFALASALSPEPKVPRVIALAVALVLAPVQVWVASRGGVLTMVIGALFVAGLARAARSTKGTPVLGISLFAGVASLAGVTMMGFSSEDAQGELLSADISKLELFEQAMRMVTAYPLFGAGRGSFESTFPKFRGQFSHIDSPALYVTFTHPENVVAQWVTEWGVPISVLAMVAIVWALRPTAVLARSTTAAGPWAALVAVTVQNLVDFSSEVPGVLLTLVVCTAIVVGGTVGRGPRWRLEGWPGRPKAVAIAGLSVAASVVLLVGLGLRRELADDEQALHQAAVADWCSLGQLKDTARAAMLRHPAEPYLPFIVGWRATRDHAPEAVLWLGAALERAQVHGPAHLALARVVATRSSAQARLEYRLAMEDAPELIDIVMREGPRHVHGYWDAMELIPEGKVGPRVLEALNVTIADRLPATRVRLDDVLEARAPTSQDPVFRLATDAVEDLEAGDAAPWCTGSARSQCVTTALLLTKSARSLDPGRCAGHALHARLLIATGDTKQGLDEFDRATDTVSDRVACLRQLVTVAAAVPDRVRVEATLEKIVRAGCSDARECVQNMLVVAQQEESLGNSRRALAVYKRAYEQGPDNDGVLAQMARLSAASGLHAEALEDYERLARRQPLEARWAEAVGRERDAVMMETVHP